LILKKTRDRFSRHVMWWVLEKKQVSNMYIDMIKVFDGTITRIRTIQWEE